MHLWGITARGFCSAVTDGFNFNLIQRTKGHFKKVDLLQNRSNCETSKRGRHLGISRKENGVGGLMLGTS